MKIATKIVLASTILCTLSVVTTGVVVGWRSSDLSETALFKRASQQMVSVRENKKNEIEDYFDQIKYQMLTTANSIGVRDAMLMFGEAFGRYPVWEVSEGDVSKLEDYYRSAFGANYKQLNDGESANEMQKLNMLSPLAKALQARYIGVNPNQLGDKHQLMSDSLGTDYDKAHAT